MSPRLRPAVLDPWEGSEKQFSDDRVVAIKRLELLKQISFDVEVAEEEVNELASYFVETNQWSQIAK